MEERITAVSTRGYTLEVEVVKGSVPAGPPAEGVVEIQFDTCIDYSTWKVGEVREESASGNTFTRTRGPDEPVKIEEKTWD